MCREEFFVHLLDDRLVQRIYWMSSYLICRLRETGETDTDDPETVHEKACECFQVLRAEAERIHQRLKTQGSDSMMATSTDLTCLERTLVTYCGVMHHLRLLQCLTAISMGWNENDILAKCSPLYRFPNYFKKLKARA